MDKLFVSVAICTFNGEKYLKEQLDSIASQSRIPDEIVLCDDCSKDGTMDIIKKYSSNSSLPIHFVVNEKNLGTIKNFEKAISLCTGDIILLSDQDDIWHPQKIERIENTFLSSTNFGAVFSNANVVDENLMYMGYTLWQSIRFTKSEQRLVSNGKSLDVLLKHNVAAGTTLAFSAQYKKYLLPIPKYCIHDLWIMLIISMKSDIAMIDERLVEYRQHSDQQIGAKKKWLLSKYLNANDHSNQDSFSNIWKNATGIPLEYELSIYKSVYERLIKIDIDPIKLSKLKSKIMHLQARQSASKKNKLLRLPIILRELFTMRYDRYSNGMIYIIKDLLY